MTADLFFNPRARYFSHDPGDQLQPPPRQSVPWGRGTGEGIGLSGHKNEYKTGVRIGNWVEEQFSEEAAAKSGAMEKFLKTQEEAQVAAAQAQQVRALEAKIDMLVGRLLPPPPAAAV